MNAMRSGDWMRIPLGDVLKQVSRPVPVDPSSSYRLLGAHWYAKGLYIKEERTGTEIQARYLFQVQAGDFVYNRLFAWKGSFAVASHEHDGCFVSNEFPCFEIDRNRIDLSFLWHFFSRQVAWSEALGLSSGSTPASRNRLKEEQFLRMEVPLPSLPDQRRIVARIEEVAGKIEEAHGLHQSLQADAQALLRSLYATVTHSARLLPMREVAPLVRRAIKIEMSVEYPELGIRSFGKGTFHKPAVSGAALGSKRLFEIRAGDLVFNNVFAWEGAVAVAKLEDRGRVGSHRFITCVPREGMASAHFLCFHFLSGQGLEALGTASPGGAGRNRTLGLEALGSIQVPVPPFDKQVWFDHIQAKVDSVKRLQAETAAELDALLPSILDKAFKREL